MPATRGELIGAPRTPWRVGGIPAPGGGPEGGPGIRIGVTKSAKAAHRGHALLRRGIAATRAAESKCPAPWTGIGRGTGQRHARDSDGEKTGRSHDCLLAGEGARRHSQVVTSAARSLYCQTLMRRKSDGNAAYLSHRQAAVAGRRTTPMVEARRAANSPPRGRLRRTAGSQPPTGGKLHAQIGESLRNLWRKVRPCQPPPSRPALLPQSLQGELPCENGEGPCVHAALVWLRTSPGFIGVAGIERRRSR
jgi:hypothetical protein